MAIHRHPETREGWSVGEACRRIEEAGADVVGLNCIRGPRTMLPLLEDVREACDGHIAALPVPYRTTEAEPTFQSLTDPGCDLIPDGRPFPTALDPFTCNRYELAAFTTAAADVGVSYFGVCCGAAPHHIRSVAEALGRTPPASRFSADMSRHAYFGTDDRLKASNRKFADRVVSQLTSSWGRGRQPGDSPNPARHVARVTRRARHLDVGRQRAIAIDERDDGRDVVEWAQRWRKDDSAELDRLADGDELAGEDELDVVEQPSELVVGQPGQGLHVLLPGRRVAAVDGGGSGQQAILGAETEDRLVEGHEPAATAVGVGGELVGQAGERVSRRRWSRFSLNAPT